MTALSAGAYPAVADRYVLLPHGASFGEGYGPIVVAREELDPREVEIVTPGPLTTATRVLRLALGDDVRTRDLPFDEVLDEVVSGRAEAGLLIHEGQLTFAEHGLCKLLDLGVWWRDETGLPLPLGLVAARRDLDRLADASAVVREAIDAGLANRDEAMAYAMGFGRGIDASTADEFVAMYVNDLTLDMGDRGPGGDRRGCSASSRSSRMNARSILSAVRTPVGRYGGGLAGTRPDDLAAIAVRAAVERAGVPPEEIEDVWLGCANQAGEDNRDVARMAVLLAGLPGVGRRCHGQPPVRVGARRDRRRMPRGDRRRRRSLRRGRRRVDVARAARHCEARYGVSARRPHAVRHDARLALPESAAGGALPARDDGRDRRERRRALGGLA